MPEGSEQGGRRPALVVSTDVHNERARTVIVAPLTTNLKRAVFPQNVLVEAANGEVRKDSVVLGEQLRTLAKSRLETKFATLTDDTMERVDDALRKALDL